MVISASPDNQAVDYRYFLCDLMTNSLLVEIPFKSVSYSRSLTEAGTFSGDIAITEDTFNLSVYENTLPAKTALYVVRNGICVWGGIVWGRTYSLVDKILSITAAEFTSYLSHRVVWKTWNSAYEATAVVSAGTATVTLFLGQYDFKVGEAVYIDWGTIYKKYNGYFVIKTVGLTADDRSFFTADAFFVDSKTKQNKQIPNLRFGGTDLETGDTTNITVETRQDTYQYARDLLRELDTDLFDFDFANDAIRPGIDLFNEIASVSRSSNVAEVVLTKKHELTKGQKISVSDVEIAGFNNKEAIVKDVIDDKTFTYENTGADTSADLQPFVYTISSFRRAGNIAEYTTTTSHDLQAGDIIYIENVSETFDGYFTVLDRPSNTLFRAVMFGAPIGLSRTDTSSVANRPIATREGAVSYGSFGEHTTLGDLGIDLSQTPESSGSLEANPVIRGFELKTVAEIFEDYSTKPNGFEYRIDCVYDSTSNSFKKYFKFLPLLPTSLTSYLDSVSSDWSGSIPASAYGADRIIFEYPGNILEAQFEENAEEGATRFFVKGKDDRLNADASQPYSAASNHKLLNAGWPLLDSTDDMDSADETVLWRQASRLLEESVPPISTFTISVNGSVFPLLGTYNPGDWCSVKLNDDFVTLRANSFLEQDYGTDNGVLVRKILSFSVNVPDSPSFPEQVSLDLVTEPSVPISGVQIIDGKVFSE